MLIFPALLSIYWLKKAVPMKLICVLVGLSLWGQVSSAEAEIHITPNNYKSARIVVDGSQSSIRIRFSIDTLVEICNSKDLKFEVVGEIRSVAKPKLPYHSDNVYFADYRITQSTYDFSCKQEEKVRVMAKSNPFEIRPDTSRQIEGQYTVDVIYPEDLEVEIVESPTDK